MSVKPCSRWVLRHNAALEAAKIEAISQANREKFKTQEEEKAKIEAITKANLARFQAQAAEKAKLDNICRENLAKMAREREALRLARTRLSASEWESWCSKVSMIARIGKPGYDPQTLLSDLSKWGIENRKRFYNHFDPNYIAPAAMR